MKNKDIKFKSLTPEILPRNKEIYTEALDYAFSKDDVRNIAITGVYGAGKSSVWNTYRKQKSAGEESSDFDNIITICLGKYNDKKEQNDNSSEKELENRVERQIINQITAQIKSSKAPMSKYKYKGNLGKWKLSGVVFLTLLFFGQFFLWGFRKEIVEIVSKTFTWFDNSIVLYSTLAMFISSVGIFLIHFFKKGRLKFSKIQYKDMEAQFTESNQSDETILERDIKEIVYLLSSSNTSVVVFEDLDRYESVDIFIKLKELNFLLNAYLDTNGLKVRKNKKDRIVRFIYLIKDGLFDTKDRTKFFDFILPIIPVVDSKTSENHLIELLGLNNSQDENQDENQDESQDEKSTEINEQDISLNNNKLRNIALYIDDMRILRNIVNEFKVYSSSNVINLDYDKLFALVTVKNIYPREFELLQQDKGYIFDIFNQIDKVKIQKNSEYKDSIKSKRREVNELFKDFLNDKYEKMSLYITTDVVIVNNKVNNNKVETWAKFLSDWESVPQVKYQIKSDKSNGQPIFYDYDTFLDTFVYTSDDIIKSIKKFKQDRHNQIKELLTEIKDLERQRKQIQGSRVQDLISNMKPDEINELFKVDSKENTFSEYPLVRYLIVEGILDETYWYYKGNFDVDKLHALKRNDYIFLKRLLEKGEPDIFFKLESPKEIMNRLKPVDFTQFSILNLYLFDECVKNKERKKILNTIIAVDNNNLYKELIQIINMLSLEKISYIVDVIIDNKIVLLERILNWCSEENQNVFRNLTYSILMNEKMLEDEEDKFKDYIQENENLIEFVTDDNLNEFIERAREKNIKFNDLKKIVDINKENFIDKIISQLSKEDNQIKFTTYEARNDLEESDSVGFGKYLNMSSDNVYSSILDMVQNGTNNDDLIEFVEADERLILDDTEIINFNISLARDILIGNMKERLIQIEKYQLYRITLNNIIFLAENILGEKIKYGRLLSKIYENDKLESMQEYIDNNFDKVISEYIEQNSSNNEYDNTQEILIKILNSNISLENKKRYVDKNSTSIKNLEDINTDTSLVEVLDKLFDKDKISFTSSNLDYYWNLLNEYKLKNNKEAQKYLDSFIEVLNKRLSMKSGKSKTISSEANINEILSQCDSICNTLINSEKVDDNLFDFAIEKATETIEQLNPLLNKERIARLDGENLIEDNKWNNKIMKEKLTS